MVASTVATTTTTTATTATATTATTTTATTTTATQPPALIARGVTIGGVPVGGLDPDSAYYAVKAQFDKPLVLLVGRRRLRVTPARVGASPYIRTAVARARIAPPRKKVALVVAVQGAQVRSYMAALAKRFDRASADSRLFLRGLRPYITPEQIGRSVDRTGGTTAIVRALKANKRGPLSLRLRTIAPSVTRSSFGPVIVIRRGSNRLYLYNGMRFRRVFGVATGQASYPTPLGRFSIAVMWRHPWWYPPASDWAKDEKPVPPGPGNPLGTRWMGLTAPLVGIHGTPDAASIGYSASHGCIRMRIPEAEWLFSQVRVGTPVFIVPA